jgi:predicted Zn-dependent peptidase
MEESEFPPIVICKSEHSASKSRRPLQPHLRMTNERNIRRTVLPSGLIVLTERMEHVRSVAMGVWMRAGSRHEVPELNGISHFVEHMVFKGTKSRTAQRIAREVDAIGGNLDAFTGKETVCFNIKVLDDHVPTALDVLSDLVLNPVFAAEEITRERGVILEEIKMDEDNPDTLVHEIFMQNFWKDHPLSKPILGTRETVRSFEHNTLLGFFEQRFRAGNMVFSAAGNLEHDSFVELVERHFGSLASGTVASDTVAPQVTPRIHLRNKKSLEQVQLCLGVPAPPVADASRYTTLVLNVILGGGMSSRLFQTVREERGLVYSIYSDLNPYSDTGSLCVYAGTSADRALQVIDLIMEEFRRLKTEPLQADELRRAKDQLRGNLLLSLESSMSRMSNLARQQMYFERFFGLEEILDKVEGVSEEQVMAMAANLFRSDKVALTLLGRLDGLRLTRSHLDC